MWDCEAREELSNENIVSKDDDGLGEGGVIMVECRQEDSFVEDGVSEDVDQKDLPLSNGKMKEVERDFIGRGIQDQGNSEMEGTCLMEHLISSTSWSSPGCYQTASACPSSWGQYFVIPRR